MTVSNDECEKRRAWANKTMDEVKKSQEELSNTSLRNTIVLENITDKLSGHIEHEEKTLSLIFDKLDEKIKARIFYWIMGLLITFLVPFAVYTTVNITKVLTILEAHSSR